MATRHVVCPHCDAVNRIPEEKPAIAGKCGQCGRPLFEGRPVSLDSRRFHHHLRRSDLPLLVDFWAPWCAPCRSMAPAFERTAAALEPRLRLVKINTDAEQALAAEYNVRSVPTLALFAGGRERARTAGAMDQRRLTAWVEHQLGRG